MNQPQKVREVYAELRRVYGEKISAGELLRLSAALVETYQNLDVERYGDFGYPTREPFFFLEVDEAMRDGGWRILNFEQKTGMELSDELPDGYLTVQARIQHFVGKVQWPRIEME